MRADEADHSRVTSRVDRATCAVLEWEHAVGTSGGAVPSRCEMSKGSSGVEPSQEA